MPERVNAKYGKIGENETGIVEFIFDTNIWKYEKSGNELKVIRKEA